MAVHTSGDFEMDLQRLLDEESQSAGAWLLENSLQARNLCLIIPKMKEKTYKCASAKATANRIWKANFDFDSFCELVDSKNPDAVVASVGMSDVSSADQRVRMVATLYNHPWSQEIATILIEEIQYYEPPLPEWSIEYKNLSWTITMSWRD